MITAKLRKVGGSYVVTVPLEEIEPKQLREGQLVTLEVNSAEAQPTVPSDLREALDIEFEKGKEALRHLAGR